MLSHGQTDKGILRGENQDNFFVREEVFGPLPNLFIVADGMGGHKAGSFASHYAIKMFCDFIFASKQKVETADDAVKLFEEAIKFSNLAVYNKAKQDEFKNMGTTFVAVTKIGNMIAVLNIGDSRLYIIDDEDISQITEDHSLVRELYKLGKIELSEIKTHPKKNIITRAVGVETNINPDFFTVKLNPGAMGIMCSDGLYNMVREEEIVEIVKEQDDIKIGVTRLIEKANENGGRDNITVIIFK